MNSRRKTGIIALLICLLMMLCLALYGSLLTDGYSEDFLSDFFTHLERNAIEVIMIIVTGVSSIIALYELVYNQRSRKLYEDNLKYLNSDINKLNKLLEYSQKRYEIEQEISRLTNELTNSSVSEYLDINRLVFSGQRNVVGNGAIDYDQFLSQFGIVKDTIQVKKGYAIFLTPFDKRSMELFQICSSVLNRMGILLQRTDNVVDKNDIMMNIIAQIVQAEFVIVNIDGRNPNVYYELGIAHAIGKPTILVSNVDYPDDSIGFDVRQKQIVLYKNIEDLEKGLLYQINRLRDTQP